MLAVIIEVVVFIFALITILTITALVTIFIFLCIMLSNSIKDKKERREYLKSLDITDMYGFTQLMNYNKHPKEGIYTIGELRKVYNEMRGDNLL